MSFARSCRTVVVPLIIIMIAAVILMTMGLMEAAWAISYLGTPLVIIGNLLYIVTWHSRSRWPDKTWSQRLTKVIWFER